MALITQFLLACVIGCAAFLALMPYPENPLVPLYGGLIAGFAGQWAAMFLYVWLRYGWSAARSLRMDNS